MNKSFSLLLTASTALFLYSCSSYTPDTRLTADIKEWNAGQDDSAARIKLRNATHMATMNDDKYAHEADLLFALKNSTSSDVKAFIIHELKLIGGVASIKPLGEYLLDNKLGGHASQALLAINNSIDGEGEGFFSTYNVASALSAALPNARGQNLLYIVKALGSVREFDDDTLERLEQMTKSGDTVLKHAAVRAVAERGEDSSAEVMLAAIEGEKQFNRSKMITYNLMYAVNLDESDAQSHTLKVMSKVDRMKEVHSFIKCLSALQEIKEDEFTDDLISYLGDENLRIAVAAVYLLADSKDASLNAKLVKSSAANGPLFQAQALKVMALRKAPKTSFLIGKALGSENQYLRSTAAVLASQAEAEDVVDGLIHLVKNGTDEDRKVAVPALNRVPAKDCAGSLIKAFQQADDKAKSFILTIMSAKKDPALADLALQSTLNSDPQVKKEAYKTLKNIAGFSQVPKIIALMKSNEDNGDLKNLQTALVSASFNRDKETAQQILSAVHKGSSARSNLALIQVLSRVGSQTAFNGLTKLYNTGSETVQKEVIRTLAKWQSADELHDLMKFTAATDGSSRTLLVRGLSTLIVNETENASKKKELLTQLSELAPDEAEKAKIIDLKNKIK